MDEFEMKAHIREAIETASMYAASAKERDAKAIIELMATGLYAGLLVEALHRFEGVDREEVAERFVRSFRRAVEMSREMPDLPIDSEEAA